MRGPQGIVIGLMQPGPFNAITDVPGVRVGHVTLVRGDGPLVVGEGLVRTGATAILPHGGTLSREACYAQIFYAERQWRIDGRWFCPAAWTRTAPTPHQHVERWQCATARSVG